MRIVILAEKPLQAFAYASAIAIHQNRQKHEIYLSSDIFPDDEIIITWAEGHLIALDEPKQYDAKYGKFNLNNLPFFPEIYRTHIISKTKEQYQSVKKHLKSANLIILATDPDREGELVAYRILQYAKVENKQIKRLWANSQEKEELRRAFKELRNKEFSYPYYIEAETRQLADYLVGMNLTQAITLTMQKEYSIQKGVYSVGRVQTPTLAFVVENHLNIKDFQSKMYYQIHGKIQTEKGEILMKSPLKFADKESLLNLLREEGIEYHSSMVVTHVKEIKSEQLPPPLLTLGGVQTLANKEWKYSLEKTLRILQSLYQKGYLSYPRTDCPFITEDVFQYLKEYAPKYLALFGRKERVYFSESRKQYVDDQKVLEHYAIVPTRKLLQRQYVNKEELNIYSLVVLYTLQMFLPNVQYTIKQVTGNIGRLEFVGGARELTHLGYLSLFDYKPTKRSMFDALAYLKEGAEYPIEIFCHEIQTKPPKRLTQASLGALGGVMEKAKIGTPATRAHIVQTLLAREYIVEIKHQLYPTEKGMKLYRLLELKQNMLISPEMTAIWEKQLASLEGSRDKQQAFLNDIKLFITRSIEQLS